MSASVWSAAPALVLAALLVSCGGDASSPVAPTPEAPASPVPETPSPSPSPVSTREAQPAAVASPTPSPTAASSPTPTGTPVPNPVATLAKLAARVAIEYPEAAEYVALTLGEPRYQPPGYALFSILRACFWNCGGGWVGVARTVFDERSGILLVDDPLEGLKDIGDYINFGVSASGQRMAATRCLAGECSGLYGASDDAEEELWVSDDEGETWANWGALTPDSWIVRVTDEDVAVSEWAEAGSTIRWVRSGKTFAEPEDTNVWLVDWDGDTPIWSESWGHAAPPALAELMDWTWRELQTQADGSTVWWATRRADILLLMAVVNPQGMVEEMYGWPNADYVDWLVPMGDRLFAGFRMEGGYVIGRDHLNFLIDLDARTVHPLLGLPDGEEGFPQPWRAVPLSGH